MSSTATGVVRRVLTAVDQDAADDGVSRRTVRLALWVPGVGAVLIALAALHQPTFLALVQEDGPVEWTQFAAFAAAGGALAVAAVLLARRRDPVAAVLVAIGALGFLGIAGEEISWGQRVLGLETPESLSAINHQDEINLHNITSFPMQRIGNYLQLVIAGVGMALPWLTRTRPPLVRNRLLRLLSPSLFLTPAFALLFAYRAVRLVWDSQVMTVVKYGEWPELMLALGILGYALLLVRSLRRPDDRTPEPPRTPQHARSAEPPAG